MSTKSKKSCPKCGEQNALVCHGKRYAVYPAGCLYLIGMPYAILHQTSAPIDYECKACGTTFGKRTAIGKLALILLIILPLASIAWIVFSLSD